MYSERNEKLKAGDMVFVVGEICHYFCLVVYSLFVVLKYLCLLIYYTVVDGTWSLISADLLTRQSIFKSKALICGVGGELGKLLALRFARSGVHLILWEQTPQAVDEALEYLQQRGINRVRGQCVDFSNVQNIYGKAEQLRADYGELDLVITNFLYSDPRQLEDPTQNSSTILYHIIGAFLPSMLIRNKGHIVTLTSVYGLFGGVSRARLTANAHSVVGMMEALRLNTKGTQIKTTTICSSAIKTSSSSSSTPQQSSWLLPAVEPDYLARSIIEAVEIGQEMRLIPTSAYFLRSLRNMTPTRFSDRFLEMLGNDYTYVGTTN